MCNIPLLDIPKQILEKYKDHPISQKKDVLLPVLSNQRMNTYIHEIAEVCGIKKEITTHTARHREDFYRLLINRLHSIHFPIGNDLETSFVLRYA